jgi:thioredoxin reductase (NADPH)
MSAVPTKIITDGGFGIAVKKRGGEEEKISCDGIFVSIGREPSTSLFAGEIQLDESGYVVAGEDTKTSIPGVFAAGDVRTKELRQVITAASDGATAAHMAGEYLA